MPYRQAQKLLFFAVRFLKRTSFHHKKKLITLVVIALIYYTAKKKLRLIHLLQVAQKITALISYLPLPSFPQYRQLNRYESVRLNPLLREIIQVMKVDEIKSKIKQKKAEWNELKLSIFSGTVLSLVLYNVQSFYFIVQNKYEPDFRDLKALQVFERLMGDIRKKFINEITVTFQTLSNVLKSEVEKIEIKASYNIDDYFAFIERMVEKVFEKKFLVKKTANQLVQNTIYKNEEFFELAKNYFMTPYQHLSKKKSKFSKFTSAVSKILSGFNLFGQPVCELSAERYELAKIAFQMPLKKSIDDSLVWPNKQSELLSRFVLLQIDQTISSVNFSTILNENAQYNAKVLKNRLFLYFTKNNLETLRTAESLAVFYKLIKEEILITSPQGSSINGDDRRERFYEAEILKAIKRRSLVESNRNSPVQCELLIKQDANFMSVPKAVNSGQQQMESRMSKQAIKADEDEESEELAEAKDSPELILLNMHLEQILQSRQLSHVVKQFEIKYFNERSGVTLSPMQKAGGPMRRPGREEEEVKGLLEMLGSNEQLNKQN